MNIIRDNNTCSCCKVKQKDLATINGKINGVTFLIVCDSGANISIIPLEICNNLGLKIDTKKIRKLTGCATEKKSIGMVYNISIELIPGCTIVEDFVVIENYPKQELILSRTCLKRYNYDLLESRRHMAITCNEKNYFIPII